MYYRRKVILSLLKQFGGSLSKIRLQKLLFLFTVEQDKSSFYFAPYKFGGYSFQANQDLKTMTKYNLVEEVENNWNLKTDNDYRISLKDNDKISLLSIYKKYNSLNDRELIKYVYENYPYYAVNSQIKNDILNSKFIESKQYIRPVNNINAIYSIGYEGITIEQYVNKLIKNDIKVLCDVRKNAMSMKFGFSKNQLKNILNNVDIEYLHFPELGIQSVKRKELNNFEDYQKLFKEYKRTTLENNVFKVSELINIYNKYDRIALTCFEHDHNYCHRSEITKKLKRSGLKIVHL